MTGDEVTALPYLTRQVCASNRGGCKVRQYSCITLNLHADLFHASRFDHPIVQVS